MNHRYYRDCRKNVAPISKKKTAPILFFHHGEMFGGKFAFSVASIKNLTGEFASALLLRLFKHSRYPACPYTHRVQPRKETWYNLRNDTVLRFFLVFPNNCDLPSLNLPMVEKRISNILPSLLIIKFNLFFLTHCDNFRHVVYTDYYHMECVKLLKV